VREREQLSDDSGPVGTRLAPDASGPAATGRNASRQESLRYLDFAAQLGRAGYRTGCAETPVERFSRPVPMRRALRSPPGSRRSRSHNPRTAP